MRNDTMPLINNYKVGDAEFVEITNNVGMVVTFTNFGASIYSIKYLGELMTYQAKEMEDFFSPRVYNGKALGRVAGRLQGNKYKIGNKCYKLHANDGENVLHGGKDGLPTRYFSSRIFNTTEHVHVVYTFFSKRGECGFPGNALFEVHYIVSNNKPKLKIKLLSYVTEKCPVSLSSHTFFSLGEPNLNNASLTINASKSLEVNPTDLIFGNEIPVSKALDFRKGKKVLKDIDAKELNVGRLKGYDHCFVFDKVEEDEPQVVMENDKFLVNIFTDFDSAVIYTDNHDLDFKADNSKEKIRRGIAIEPQLNPSKPRFLSRNEEFDHFIRYEFMKK